MRLWRRADRLMLCGRDDGCLIQPGEPYSVRADGRLIRCQTHSPTPLDEAQLEAIDERQAIQQVTPDGKMRAAGKD